MSSEDVTQVTATAVAVRAELAAMRPLLDQRPLVQVVAGPGWGKSTLLAAWLDGREATWLPCTPQDREAARLARRLLEASPHDAADLAAPDLDAAELARRVAAWLRAQGPGRIVIDDAHTLQDSSATVLLHHLVDLLAGEVQLLVASRTDPRIITDTHRGDRATLELDATHLALDLAAVATLVERELQPDRALAARIADAVGGWPVAVRLLLETLRGVTPHARSASVDRLAGPEGPVGSYLRSLVLPEETATSRELLRYLALIEPADAAALAELTDHDRSEVASGLADLTQRGMVRPDPVEPAVVRLAPVLARTVLVSEAGSERAPYETVDRIALQLAERDRPDRALEMAADHGSGEVAATLLRAHGTAAIRRGRLATVSDAADRIPAEQRDPTIELLQAEALALQGAWTRALACLDAAGLPAEGPLPTGVALRLGLVHHIRGDLGTALASYNRAPAAATAATAGDADDAELPALLAWAATAHWLRGEVEFARDRADRAIAAARDGGDDAARSLAHTALALVAASDGDRHENLSQHEQALAAAQRADARLLEARIQTNIGSHHLEEGRLAPALAATEHAVELAESQGFAMIIGIARCNRAAIRLQHGDIDEAIADAERAREVFVRIGSRTESYAHHLLGAARLERGELSLARQAYDRAVTLGEPAGDRQALVPALIGLARVDASTDPEAATRSIERARELDAGMDRAEVRVVAAWVAAAQGRDEDAAAEARAALADARHRGSRPVEAEAVTCLAVLDDDPTERLQEALSLWEELDNPLWAARISLGLARRAGADQSATVRRLTQWLGLRGCSPDRGTWASRRITGGDQRRIAVRALGSFVVERDGHPVPPSVWGSRKARELLKVLLVREGRALTRDELAHILWPDEAYAQVSNRLSVALSVARGVLSDDTDAPSPIATDDGTVRLRLDHLDVDVIAFRRSAETGLAAARRGATDDAITRLVDAEERYTGDLLEEDLDTSWIRDRRAELRSLYTDVARTLARLVAIDDPALAMRLQLRILDRDPYDERAHLNLCLALMRAGRHGEAAERYRLYQDRMDELDLPAVPFDDLRREIAQNREQAYAS